MLRQSQAQRISPRRIYSDKGPGGQQDARGEGKMSEETIQTAASFNRAHSS
jgi:hypothetical protein